ncbi:MAG: YhcH/YjgK/YiaL family protein [Clostridiaceae bacterium]|nr:YhcH/YjgK/YiaL family protein [Clostridiaceae bacterium]
MDGKNIFAIVSEYELKNIEEGKWEAHREYLDIQYVASGKEKIRYASINEMKMIGEYNEEKDILFLCGEGDLLLVNEGTFALFAPQDVHMPGIKAMRGQHVKKIVVKILV